MIRRIAQVAILTATVALAACASPTAPTHDCGGGGTSMGSGTCI